MKPYIKVFCVLVFVLVLVAWDDNDISSPYTGSFTLSYQIDGVTSKARSIKWSQNSVNEIKTNVWVEFFDQTADCTANSPTGDKLFQLWFSTNIPNNGAWTYNDCDGPLPNVNEEVELTLNSANIVAEQSYTYDVIWGCNSSSVSGEINVTFELGTVGPKDWLAKQSYSKSNCQGLFAPPVSTFSYIPYKENALDSYDANPFEMSVNHTNGLFSYEILRTTQGELKARSQVNFNDANTLVEYRTLNNGLVSTLMESKEDLLVVVTFNSPINLEEARNFSERANFHILSYGVYGTNLQGEVVSAYHFPPSHVIEGFPESDKVSFDGVLTMAGVVNRSHLSDILDDQRVALMDVTANQIQADIETTMGEHIPLEQIGIPTPAWLIASGAISMHP